TMNITPGNRIYVITYCQTGYAPRTVRDNDNKTDGSAINPAPVRLFPTTPQLPFHKEIMRAGMDRLTSAIKDIQYYEAADKQAFSEALKDLSEDDQRLIERTVRILLQ